MTEQRISDTMLERFIGINCIGGLQAKAGYDALLDLRDARAENERLRSQAAALRAMLSDHSHCGAERDATTGIETPYCIECQADMPHHEPGCAYIKAIHDTQVIGVQRDAEVRSVALEDAEEVAVRFVNGENSIASMRFAIRALAQEPPA